MSQAPSAGPAFGVPTTGLAARTRGNWSKCAGTMFSRNESNTLMAQKSEQRFWKGTREQGGLMLSRGDDI